MGVLLANKMQNLAKGLKSSFVRFAFFAIFVTTALCAQAGVPLLDTYYSPKNKERPVRSSTRYIILHTTEGAKKGAGSKLQRNGEAHYMVDTSGKVYRIIDRKRVAYHCGRSMWNGLTSLDNCSIGIEVVGYHNQDLTAAQIKSLKNLLIELKATYKIKDDKVLTHSMVAYGAPNQWHKRSHRGRKRCGMRMALPSVRTKLGLTAKPTFDPDVKAGRLVVADKELQQLLYSVQRSSSKPKTSIQKAPEKGSSAKSGTKNSTEGKKPTATPQPKAPEKNSETATNGGFEGKTLVGGSSKPSAPLTPAEKNFKEKRESEDSFEPVDEELAAAVYAAKEGKEGNVIGPKRSAWDIARDAYNAPTTIYIFPDGSRKTGAEIRNWKKMQAGTRVIVMEEDVNAPEVVTSLAETGMTGTGLSVADIVQATETVLSTIAGAEWNSSRTIYVLPDATIIRGNELTGEKIGKLSAETKVFTGYQVGGPVTAKNPAFNICGPSWRDEGTYFLFPNGEIVSGNKVDPRKIPLKTMVLYKD